MGKLLLFIAQLIDSATFWWLIIYGYIQLWNGLTFEACALICTGVFWQRFEKEKILQKLHEIKTTKG